MLRRHQHHVILDPAAAILIPGLRIRHREMMISQPTAIVVAAERALQDRGIHPCAQVAVPQQAKLR